MPVLTAEQQVARDLLRRELERDYLHRYADRTRWQARTWSDWVMKFIEDNRKEVTTWLSRTT